MNSEKKKWTKEEADLLLKIYMLYTNKELAEMFDCKVSAINTKRTALGVGIKQLEEQANADVPEGYRRCKECGEILLLEENFYPLSRKNPKRGRMKICKNCGNANKSKERAEEKLIAKDDCSCDIIVRNKFYEPKKTGNKTHHCIKCGKHYNLK